MTIWQTIKSAFSFDWLLGKKDHGDPSDLVWQDNPFYSEEQRKNEKLDDLASLIDYLRWLVDHRKKQHKKHTDVLAAIVQAQTERLEIETGRRVYHGGAWLLKTEINEYAKVS